MRVQRVIFLFFFMLVFCTSAIADDWQKYSEFMDRFYFLDKQSFKEISCRIRLSSLEAIKEQLSNITKSSDAITITEDINTFSLTMDRDRNFTFNKPSLDIEVVSEANLKDPEKVNAGIINIKNGFQMQVDGAIEILQELLKSVYFSPRKNEYANLTFGKAGQAGSIKVTYKKDNFIVTEIHKDTVISQTETGENEKAEGKIYFQKINGKLMMNKANIKSLQDKSEITTVFLVDYQKIGSIFLPARISTKSKGTVQGQDVNLEGEFNIILADCKIE